MTSSILLENEVQIFPFLHFVMKMKYVHLDKYFGSSLLKLNSQLFCQARSACSLDRPTICINAE